MTTKQEGVLLRALDGSNPLAFLAALGAFRLLTLESPDSKVQMRWERADGAWRPRLLGVEPDEEKLCRILQESTHWAPAAEFMQSLGKNITVPKDTFKRFVNENAAAKRKDRRAADFAASFGCEICEQEGKDRIEYTDFCFITGSGHQDFLGAISALEKNTTFHHLYDALFGKWRLDEAEGMSMRWDPSDAAEYALQWTKPSLEGAWAVLGANRLAIEALPLFPTAPVKGGLQTTGFTRRNQNEFTFPIWSEFLSLNSARSLLSFCDLQKNEPPRDILHAMSLVEIYRVQRVLIGEGRNRKVSFRPARAL